MVPAVVAEIIKAKHLFPSREGFAAAASCLAKEEKVEGGARGVKSPIKVTPLAFDPYVGFVDAPTIARRLESPSANVVPFPGRNAVPTSRW